MARFSSIQNELAVIEEKAHSQAIIREIIRLTGDEPFLVFTLMAGHLSNQIPPNPNFENLGVFPYRFVTINVPSSLQAPGETFKEAVEEIDDNDLWSVC
jgi:hypothetical protein